MIPIALGTLGRRFPRDQAKLAITVDPAAPHAMLRESIEEVGVPPELMAAWLEVDAAFECKLIKRSSDECEPRYRDEGVVVIHEPPSNHRLKG